MNRVPRRILLLTLVLGSCGSDPGEPEGPPVWGASTDIPVPADYDGDGAADIAVYRAAEAEWYVRASCDDDCAFEPIQVGQTSDIPVPGDYYGSGNARPATFDAASQAMWHLAAADCAGGANCSQHHVQWGQTGDIPAPADYDGDGVLEIAIVRPGEGTWYISFDNCSWEAGCGEGVFFFGAVGDRPAPADYDGDGEAEMAFLRPSADEWHICSAAGCTAPVIIEVQGATDVLVPADYDGDGTADIAVASPGADGLTWLVR